MFPDAPALFSTTTFCPRRFDRASATRRRLVSVTPPGAKGTIRRIGRSGYCAPAWVNPTSETTRAARLRATMAFRFLSWLSYATAARVEHNLMGFRPAWILIALLALGGLPGAMAQSPTKPYRIYAITFRGMTEVEKGFQDYFAARRIPVEITYRDLARDNSRIPGFLEEIREL